MTGSYMIGLHCPNNLDPYAIEKWSLFLQCKEEGLCKEALLIPTDGVDFQFTLYIHFLLQFSCARTALSKKLGVFVFYSIYLQKK